MSTTNIPEVKGLSARKADNLTTICEMIAYKIWEPRRLTTLWASTTCYRDSFAFASTCGLSLSAVDINMERTLSAANLSSRSACSDSFR
jgi:hypothetical protein